MGDSLITVVVIVLAAVLMFVFPLLTVSENSDSTAQLSVQNATTEFVENIRSTGKITLDSYDKYIQTINSTGNTFDVQMEVQVLDENPGKKTTQVDREKIGENVYYSVYTSQIEEKLESDNVYKVKEGDIVSVSVKNTNQTLSQQLKNFFYKVIGNDTYTIAASHGGIVTATGK